MSNSDNCALTLVNCTFSGNSAENNGGGLYNDSSSPTVTNCILWGNTDAGGTDESAQVHGGTPTVNYCCIQGWTGSLGGTGNIDANPGFVRDPNDGGDGWGVGGNDDFGDLHIVPGSPCIDAGDGGALPADTADLDGDGNTAEQVPWDLDSDPRVIDGDSDDIAEVDMGSDEIVWAGAVDVSPNEPVTINPGGGADDPNEEALVIFEHTAEGSADITVVQMCSNTNPSTGFFEALGSTLNVETSIADGEFSMTVVIPFDVNDLGGDDPFAVDLMYYDPDSESWVLAVMGNTEPNAVGQRWQEISPPPLETLSSRPLGDYGVYWNASVGEGFVWANVDHTTDFSIAHHGMPNFEPDTNVDFVDFAFFAGRWLETGCNSPNKWCDGANLTGDTTVDGDDLWRFAMNWLADYRP